MLKEARKHTDIEWHLGDLATLTIADAFDLVVMTGHAFQVLIEHHELQTSLAAIRALLASNGRFAFETRNPTAQAWTHWTPDYPHAIRGTGTKMVRKVTVPFDGRTISFTHTFTNPDWDHEQISQSTLRFLDSPTLLQFLNEAGLEIEAQFGNWDHTPVTDRSPEIITIARRTPHAFGPLETGPWRTESPTNSYSSVYGYIHRSR